MMCLWIMNVNSLKLKILKYGYETELETGLCSQCDKPLIPLFLYCQTPLPTPSYSVSDLTKNCFRFWLLCSSITWLHKDSFINDMFLLIPSFTHRAACDLMTNSKAWIGCSRKLQPGQTARSLLKKKKKKPSETVWETHQFLSYWSDWMRYNSLLP